MNFKELLEDKNAVKLSDYRKAYADDNKKKKNGETYISPEMKKKMYLDHMKHPLTPKQTKKQKEEKRKKHEDAIMNTDKYKEQQKKHQETNDFYNKNAAAEKAKKK